jgi:hypothetical protein
LSLLRLTHLAETLLAKEGGSVLSDGEKWWPGDLGHPSTTGSQNGLRYAFFADSTVY